MHACVQEIAKWRNIVNWYGGAMLDKAMLHGVVKPIFKMRNPARENAPAATTIATAAICFAIVKMCCKSD